MRHITFRPVSSRCSRSRFASSDASNAAINATGTSVALHLRPRPPPAGLPLEHRMSTSEWTFLPAGLTSEQVPRAMMFARRAARNLSASWSLSIPLNQPPLQPTPRHTRRRVRGRLSRVLKYSVVRLLAASSAGIVLPRCHPGTRRALTVPLAALVRRVFAAIVPAPPCPSLAAIHHGVAPSITARYFSARPRPPAAVNQLSSSLASSAVSGSCPFRVSRLSTHPGQSRHYPHFLAAASSNPPDLCRVGGGARWGWPPSAAQTARTVFP